MKKKKTVILCIILDFGAIFCLLLAYGPITTFRDWFIPTSLGSWTHSYFASVLYSDATIAEVIAQNQTYQVEGVTDPNLIAFDNSDPGVYESIYEEQILKRDEGNDIYKIIPITGEDFDKGFILAVYDPSRISLVNSTKMKTGGQTIGQIAKSYNAVAAVNASGFVRSSSGALSPDGTVIMNGELYKLASRGLIGFNFDNVLTLTGEPITTAIENGMKDAVSFGPYLIVNGVASTFKGKGGAGLRPRTAVGQRQDGIVLFIVINGNTSGTRGCDMSELTEIFLRYGAYNAANLDGGGSSSLWAGGKLINTPCGWKECYLRTQGRYLVNAWIIK